MVISLGVLPLPSHSVFTRIPLILILSSLLSDRIYEANDRNEKLNLEQNEKLNTDKKKNWIEKHTERST